MRNNKFKILSGISVVFAVFAIVFIHVKSINAQTCSGTFQCGTLNYYINKDDTLISVCIANEPIKYCADVFAISEQKSPGACIPGTIPSLHGCSSCFVQNNCTYSADTIPSPTHTPYPTRCVQDCLQTNPKYEPSLCEYLCSPTPPPSGGSYVPPPAGDTPPPDGPPPEQIGTGTCGTSCLAGDSICAPGFLCSKDKVCWNNTCGGPDTLIRISGTVYGCDGKPKSMVAVSGFGQTYYTGERYSNNVPGEAGRFYLSKGLGATNTAKPAIELRAGADASALQTGYYTRVQSPVFSRGPANCTIINCNWTGGRGSAGPARESYFADDGVTMSASQYEQSFYTDSDASWAKGFDFQELGCCTNNHVPQITSPQGTTVNPGKRTVTWTAPAGTDTYYLRIDDLGANGTTQDWKGDCKVAQSPGDICENNLKQTTYEYTFQQNHTYRIWVHATGAGCQNFSASSPKTVTAESVPSCSQVSGPSTVTLGESVTFSADTGGQNSTVSSVKFYLKPKATAANNNNNGSYYCGGGWTFLGNGNLNVGLGSGKNSWDITLDTTKPEVQNLLADGESYLIVANASNGVGKAWCTGNPGSPDSFACAQPACSGSNYTTDPNTCNREFTVAAPATVLPKGPNVIANATCSSGKANVSLNLQFDAGVSLDPGSFDHYNVYRCSTAGCNPGKTALTFPAVLDQIARDDTGAFIPSSILSHSYSAQAVDTAGNPVSAKSPIVTVANPCAAALLPAPTLSATASCVNAAPVTSLTTQYTQSAKLPQIDHFALYKCTGFGCTPTDSAFPFASSVDNTVPWEESDQLGTEQLYSYAAVGVNAANERVTDVSRAVIINKPSCTPTGSGSCALTIPEITSPIGSTVPPGPYLLTWSQVTGAISYNVIINGAVVAQNVQSPYYEYTFTQGSSYTVIVEANAADGSCTQKSTQKTITVSSSIQSCTINSGKSVYTNAPAQSDEVARFTVSVLNAAGATLQSDTANPAQFTVNGDQTYTLKAQTNSANYSLYSTQCATADPRCHASAPKTFGDTAYISCAQGTAPSIMWHYAEPGACINPPDPTINQVALATQSQIQGATAYAISWANGGQISYQLQMSNNYSAANPSAATWETVQSVPAQTGQNVSTVHYVSTTTAPCYRIEATYRSSGCPDSTSYSQPVCAPPPPTPNPNVPTATPTSSIPTPTLPPSLTCNDCSAQNPYLCTTQNQNYRASGDPYSFCWGVDATTANVRSCSNCNIPTPTRTSAPSVPSVTQTLNPPGTITFGSHTRETSTATTERIVIRWQAITTGNIKLETSLDGVTWETRLTGAGAYPQTEYTLTVANAAGRDFLVRARIVNAAGTEGTVSQDIIPPTTGGQSQSGTNTGSQTTSPTPRTIPPAALAAGGIVLALVVAAFMLGM